MSSQLEPAAPPSVGRRVLKGGLIVAAGLFAAQLAGFLRQAALGYLLGTGPEADALAAAMAPVELWWSVLALAVIYGLVPRMSLGAAKGGYTVEDVMQPVSRLALGSSLVFIVFARPIVMLFAPGLEPETAQLGVNLLRVLALAPTAVGCSFAYSALLLSRRKFVLPSFHHAIVNVSTITFALLLHSRLGVFGFVTGYAAGAWFHLALSHLYARPLARKVREETPVRERPSLWTLLSGPGPILGQALALEVNTAVSRAYASTFGLGMTAAFDYGFKLFRVPMALLVVPLSQSLLPEISAMQGSESERRRAVRAMKRAALLTAGAAAAVMVGMMLLREPVVAILFQRGEFGEESTRAVSAVLLGYMPVILGRSVMELLSRTMFGMGIYRSPLVAGMLALAINAAICAVLPSLDPRLIGLGAIVGFGVAAVLIVKRVWSMRSDG